MAVLVHDPIQEAMLQLAEKVQVSYEKGAPCGMILAPCAAVGQKVLEQMESYVSGFDPEASLHCFYMIQAAFWESFCLGKSLLIPTMHRSYSKSS